MAQIHYLDNSPEVCAGIKVSFDHRPPGCAQALGYLCISISRKVDEQETVIYFEKVDELSTTGGAACPDQFFALDQAIDECGFAYV